MSLFRRTLTGRRAPSAPRLFPVLHVDDLQHATDFWHSVGFSVEPFDQGYAFVMDRGTEVAHLRLHPSMRSSPDRRSFTEEAATEVMIVVDDPAMWWSRCHSAGLEPTPLRTEPWGVTEFQVIDPWGMLCRIGCPA